MARSQTTDTWANSGTAWSTGSDWVGGTAPANDLTSNIAVFNTGSYTAQPQITSSTSVNGIQMGISDKLLTLSSTGTGVTLTLGSGGINKLDNSSDTISAPLVLGATQTWTNAQGFSTTTGALTVSGSVSGSGTTLYLDASSSANFYGTIILSGSNTYSGTTNIGSGLVQASLASSLGSSVVSVAGGAELYLAGSTSTYTNAITLNGGSGSTVAGNGFALRFANGTTLSSTLTLAGGNSSVGINGGGASGIATISGQIAGPGALTIGSTNTQNGTASTMILSNATNNWSGGLTITTTTGDTTTLKLGASNAIPTADAVSFTNGSGATLDMAGYSDEVDLLSSANGNGTITNSGSATSTLTIGGGSNTSASYGGVIQNGTTSSVALTKVGTGAQTLTGSNTYTGGTSVNGGELLLSNGTNGSATGSGALMVASTGTIGGIGTSASSSSGFQISGKVIAGSGQASDITGVTTITGAATLNNSTIASANLSFNLGTISGSRTSTTINVGTTGVKFTGVTNVSLTLQGATIIPMDTTYVLISGVNSGGLLGVDGSQYTGITTAASGADGLAAGEYAITGGLSLSFTNDSGFYGPSILFLDTRNGADNIDVEVVPEPSSWALALAGLSLLLLSQRNRRRNW